MSAAARFVAVVKSGLFSIVLAFAAFAPDGASATDRFHHHRFIDRIVVFGDSLSDTGNAFALSGGQFVAPPDYGMGGETQGIPDVIPLIPAFPYKTERFSNGRTWIELLASAAGLASSVKPAVPGVSPGSTDGRASNYAVGGATAADIGVSQVPLGAQVDLFLSDVGGLAPPDALYVIAIGGNDIRIALALGPGVLHLALASVGENIAKLYQRGARKFLIWNAPNAGRTPAIQRLDPLVCPPAPLGCLINAATEASEGYNLGLVLVLQQAAALLPEIEIVPFNTFEGLEAIVADPRRFGLRDATTACIQPHVPIFGVFSQPPFRCQHPEHNFFWDGIHPTRAGHRIIADLVAKQLRAELVLDD
jgi:phospholipase/lecithinase/hemolysin